jgi:alpha-glucosidase
MPWESAVIYQVYVRSFQDSNGDGVGDLPGVTARLEHIAGLGAAAVWLSPIYPSPNADFGYDVTDFTSVEPTFGTLTDFDALVARAHQLGLKVLLDFVPCHTSILHPWFRQHPDLYVWADAPVNNWRSAFAGSSWALDQATGRYYLHSFFPEQADLNWRNPEVRERMTKALRFWLDRGVDGFRLDALDRLMKDPHLRDDPPASGAPPLPVDHADAELEHTHSRNAPDIGVALGEIRRAVGSAFLVGEVFLPTNALRPYLEFIDVAFSFDALFAAEDPARLRQAVDLGLQHGGIGWVLSNHDFGRLASRAGPENARASTLLSLTLPGPVFIFQGDELGMPNVSTVGPPQDRHGRDGFRVTMRWDESRAGGFTSGVPWVQSAEPLPPSVEDQDRDPASMLSMVRKAVALRGGLEGSGAHLLDSPPGTIVLARAPYLVAVNLGEEPRRAPTLGSKLVLESRPGDGADLAKIPAHGGWVAHLDS